MPLKLGFRSSLRANAAFPVVDLVEITAVSVCFCSLSGPQRRDKLTLPPSLFVSFIPVEIFQKEKSVNIPHRKTGV